MILQPIAENAVRHGLEPLARPGTLIVRAARKLGEDLVFESSGPRLWSQLRQKLNGLMTDMWQLGAFRGATPREAFEVVCDRSVMTQNDLDNGRAIARIRFESASPIETITFVLALNEGGQASLVSASREGSQAA